MTLPPKPQLPPAGVFFIPVALRLANRMPRFYVLFSFKRWHMSISIPPHLQSEPWSSILWADVQQYISLLNQHAPPQQNPFVVDVGANIGFAAIVFHLAYHADVLSIEAIPQTYFSLQKNCASCTLQKMVQCHLSFHVFVISNTTTRNAIKVDADCAAV